MRNYLLILILLISTNLKGQNIEYAAPLKIPLLLSGSFAELRSNHFHSGVDFKTQSVTGLPVYTAADGYISRIVVSPTGFGHALYIDHPNGTTSVYGHLNNFRNDIAAYVKNIQYENLSFRVDISVPNNKFPVKQGDEIAKSGNTGNSGGPHLHFEIRNTVTEEPLNPLKYNFPIVDNTAPKITSLLIAPLDELSQANNKQGKKSTYQVVFYDGKYHLKSNPVVPVFGNIGFAVQAEDYFDNSWSKCGIYSIELNVDDEVCFVYRQDKFSFDETKYINSFIDYEEYINSGIRYQKTWIEPGNKLSVYNYDKNNGICRFDDNNTHLIQMILKDTYGNSSVLEFKVKSSLKEISIEKEPFTEIFAYNESNRWKTNDFELSIPEDALYTNINFEYKNIPADPDFFSGLHIIHKRTVPLHKSARIKIKTKSLPKHLESKALLVTVDTARGTFSAAGGNFENGWVIGEISSFGNYTVAVDTISPAITPLSIKDKNTLTEANRIRFKISDKLSGVNKYEGFIDGNWVLFEYDPRTDQIVYYFDSERFETGKRHELLLTVTDTKQNTITYEGTFWK